MSVWCTHKTDYCTSLTVSGGQTGLWITATESLPGANQFFLLKFWSAQPFLSCLIIIVTIKVNAAHKPRTRNTFTMHASIYGMPSVHSSKAHTYCTHAIIHVHTAAKSLPTPMLHLAITNTYKYLSWRLQSCHRCLSVGCRRWVWCLAVGFCCG